MHTLMFFRMRTVYPLLCYFMRVQNFTVILGTEWPGYVKVFIVNLLLVAVGCFCAMFYDKVIFIQHSNCKGSKRSCTRRMMKILPSPLCSWRPLWPQNLHFPSDWWYHPIYWKFLRSDLHVFPALLPENALSKRGLPWPEVVRRTDLVTYFALNSDTHRHC